MKKPLKLFLFVIAILALLSTMSFVSSHHHMASIIDENVEAICSARDSLHLQCTGPKEYHFLTSEFYCRCENYITCRDLSGCF